MNQETSIISLRQRAEAYLTEGKLELAKECYLEAIALAPNQGIIYHKLGEILSLQKKWQEAVDAYCQALNFNQNLAFSYHKLGEALKELGSYRQAVEAYKSAIKLNPQFPWSYHKLGEVSMELENWDDAIFAYRRFREINPNLFVSYKNLGDVLMKLSRWDEAVATYYRGLEIDPNSYWGNNNLGKALMKLSRFEEALAAFQKAVEIKPNLYFAYHNLGDVLSQLQRWDEAAAKYRQALEINPNSYWSYNNLGEVLGEKGEFEGAIAAFNEGIKLNSKDGNVYGKLGNVYLKLEKWEAAMGCFIRALKNQLDYYDAFKKIAYIFKKQGKIEAANNCINSHEIPAYLLEKFCDLKGDWTVKSSDKHSNITRIELYPDTEINLVSSKTIGNKIHPSFQAQKANLPSAYIVTVTHGRALNYGSITAVISSDNKIVTDICKGSAGLVLSSSNLPPISDVDGTVAFLSIFPEDSYFFWMLYVVARLGCLLESGINLASIDKFFFTRCDRKFQKESLEILGIPHEKIAESRFIPHIKADRLIVPSIPHWRGLRNPKWACDFLKKIFLQGRENSDRSSYSERIYISRQLCSWRRVINEEEVISFLNKLGFTTIILEKMHLREQALCLANAKVIVAPHGAGLVNLVFSQPGTKVIEFFSPNYFHRGYWQISNICGLDHYHLIGEIFEEEYQQVWEPNILVDLKKLRKILALAAVIE